MVLPRPGRGAGTLIPSAQRFVWAARQPLGNAALGKIKWAPEHGHICSESSGNRGDGPGCRQGFSNSMLSPCGMVAFLLIWLLLGLLYSGVTPCFRPSTGRSWGSKCSPSMAGAWGWEGLSLTEL